MENKVRIEGTITNEFTLSKYNTIMIFLKHSYKKKDGTMGGFSITINARDRVAQEAAARFKRNDVVRVEGILVPKVSKFKNDNGEWIEKLDQNGKEVWEMTVLAHSINALTNMQSVIPQKPLEERMGYNPANPPAKGPAYIPKGLPAQPPYNKNKNQPGSSFDNQPLPVAVEDPNQVFEEIFDNDLPF